MTLLSSPTQDAYLIIGGGGFLGGRIIALLAERGEKNITALDLRQITFSDPKLSFVKTIVADITDQEQVRQACKGKSVVIHTASPVHGLGKTVYFKVNVEGTRNVVNICVEEGVKKLVFTSSAGVIFNGHHLINADETTPPLKVHMDAYNETKALAEDLVIKANGKGGLLTAAVRPSGIFGPADNQGMKTFVEMAASGSNHLFMIGNNTNLFDWTYVDNAAWSNILAADKLVNEKSEAAGQVFNITDDSPGPFWDIPKAFYRKMGIYNSHTIVIPVFIAFFFAYITEFFVFILKPIKAIHPNFTLFRIRIVTVNRYYNISKAKRILGYKPIVSTPEAIQKSADYWKKIYLELKAAN